MSHNFLFETYTYINRRRQTAQARLEAGDVSPLTEMETRGRIEILDDLDRYLRENLNCKLPRRLQKNMKVTHP